MENVETIGMMARAKAFLKERLTGGRCRTKLLLDECQACGISKTALYNARKKLGVESGYYPEQFGGSYWAFPKDVLTVEEMRKMTQPRVPDINPVYFLSIEDPLLERKFLPETEVLTAYEDARNKGFSVAIFKKLDVEEKTVTIVKAKIKKR